MQEGNSDIEGNEFVGSDIEGSDIEGSEFEGSDVEGSEVEGSDVEGSEVADDLDASKKLPRPWRNAQSAVEEEKESLYEMICRHKIILQENSFEYVQSRGFKNLMRSLAPDLVIPPKATMMQDCLKIYKDEKELIRSYLEKSKPRMSFGINTWVNEYGITYLCLTGHFIDENWEMNRLILSLIPCPIDEFEEATDCIDEFCLAGWGIDQVFAVTINYKPSKSPFVNYLGEKFVRQNKVLFGGKYLQLRCLTTIINRVARNELNKEAELVDRVRSLVRYFSYSDGKSEKLKELLSEENMESNKPLFLDNPYKWNSVLFMLESALRYESAFEKYAVSEVEFLRAFMPGGAYGGLGLPTKSDWTVVRALSKMLRQLYAFRSRVSGHNYYSSNASAFFGVLKDMSDLVNDWATSHDNALATIAARIKSRSSQYLGGPEKMNAMLYIVVVFDPRYKLEYVLRAIKGIYEGKTGENVCDLAKKALFDLFEEYKKLYGEKDESELDMYLSENVEIDTEDFDVLGWWKINGPRFPVLSKMARDLFAMPISTVAFESDFSTGGVLSADDYRFNFSWDNDMMQPLVCAADWLRDEPKKCKDEEDVDESDVFMDLMEPLVFLQSCFSQGDC